jgi:hypothetical protein
VQNPVTGVWEPQYRGVIDGYSYDFSGAVNAAGEPLIVTIALECVDAFDYLAGVEMIPGLFGEVPVPAGVSGGVVFYEDTDFQTRLIQLAADAGWPSARTQFFTGNVDVQESRYNPGDSVLEAMRDVVDAEFPFVANLFVNRYGDVCAHGRKARFDPEGTASGTDWNFTRWKAGDGAAVALDPDRAQIRPPLAWSRPRSRIINAALAYPNFPIAGTGGGTFDETDIPDQIRTDADVDRGVRLPLVVGAEPADAGRDDDRERREGRDRPVRRLRHRELQGSAHPGGGADVQEHGSRRPTGGGDVGADARRRHQRRRSTSSTATPAGRRSERVVLRRGFHDEDPSAEPRLRHGRAHVQRESGGVLRD